MYNEIARYYDLSHADLDNDVALVQSLAQEARGPALEVGCGTGRLLLPLARFTPVIGLDNSAAMLALARDKVRALPTHQQDNVTLLEADMADFELSAWAQGNVGLALISYNTFMHLETAAALQALAQIHQALAENGRLFIDLANPFAIANTPDDPTLTLERTFLDPEQNQLVLQFASNQIDTDNQLLHVTWIYDATPPEGGPLHRTVAQMAYHYRLPHQIEMMLQESGFRLQQFAGDYDLSLFDEESSRLLVLAQRQ